MEPEAQRPERPTPQTSATGGLDVRRDSLAVGSEVLDEHDLYWAIVGPQGVRAGWLVFIFACLFLFFDRGLGTIAIGFYPNLAKLDFLPSVAFFSELIHFLAMLGAGAILLRIEGRRPLDYNLTGPRPWFQLVNGFGTGFAALSVLVGILAWGGWLRFGSVALSGPRIFSYAALWGCVFLLVGCVEEGLFRCYALYTLTRGINFWWAMALVAGLCLSAFLFTAGQCTWGVYAIALLGLVPCLLLHLNKVEGAEFWQAAWATSTGFGFVHTFNNGENWIGIFTAAFIGFVFCVSIRVTGSAWWAIGCHAAWDWAETYFYGTADSGFAPAGHYLTTAPAGNALWSGGADGPEGSLLVLPVVLLLLALLLVVYGRGKRAAVAVPAVEQLAG